METNTKTAPQQLISHKSAKPYGQWQLEITIFQEDNWAINVHYTHNNPSNKKKWGAQNINSKIEAIGFIFKKLVVEHNKIETSWVIAFLINA